MKAYEYEAVISEDGDVYCVECAPKGDNQPIFASEELTSPVTCDACGCTHDYMVILEEAEEEEQDDVWDFQKSFTFMGWPVFVRAFDSGIDDKYVVQVCVGSPDPSKSSTWNSKSFIRPLDGDIERAVMTAIMQDDWLLHGIKVAADKNPTSAVAARRLHVMQTGTHTN